MKTAQEACGCWNCRGLYEGYNPYPEEANPCRKEAIVALIKEQVNDNLRKVRVGAYKDRWWAGRVWEGEVISIYDLNCIIDNLIEEHE